MEEKDTSQSGQLPQGPMHVLVDGHLRVIPATFHSLSLFPDISALVGVSSASWLASCQTATRRPANPASGPKSQVETVTETSIPVR